MEIKTNPTLTLIQTYLTKIDKLNDKERDCFIGILKKIDTTTIIIPSRILSEYELGKLKYYLQKNGQNMLLINDI